MDFSLFISIICVIIVIYVARSIFKSRKIINEINKQRALRDHLLSNILDSKECCCTIECLRQTKNLRLNRILGSNIYRTTNRTFKYNIIGRIGRPFQFTTESSFGGAP